LAGADRLEFFPEGFNGGASASTAASATRRLARPLPVKILTRKIFAVPLNRSPAD
jgi:hypothetical protein